MANKSSENDVTVVSTASRTVSVSIFWWLIHSHFIRKHIIQLRVCHENENLKRKVYNIIISLYHEACTNPEQENDPVSKKLEPFETCLKSHNRSFSGIEIRKMFMFSSLAVDRNEHDHQIGWNHAPYPCWECLITESTRILACRVKLNNMNFQHFVHFNDCISVVNLKRRASYNFSWYLAIFIRWKN